MNTLTSRSFNRIIEESINKVISENNLHVMDRQIAVLSDQVKELDKEDARIKRKIDYLKNIAKTVPEEANRVQGEIDSLSQQLADVRSKKIPIKAEIKRITQQIGYKTSSTRLKNKAKIINEPAETTTPKRPVSMDTLKKRGRSRAEIAHMRYDENMENLYNSILRDGYLLISKGAEVLVMSGNRRKVKSINGKVHLLKDYLKRVHPDKKVKYQLIARKRREWRQLDDIEYYDLKVMIVDNNTINFSPEDLPTDMSNY